MTVTSITTTQGFIIRPATADQPARVLVPFTVEELDVLGCLLDGAEGSDESTEIALTDIQNRIMDAADEIDPQGAPEGVTMQ